MFSQFTNSLPIHFLLYGSDRHLANSVGTAKSIDIVCFILTGIIECSADVPFLKFASPGAPLSAMYNFRILFNDVTCFDAKRPNNFIKILLSSSTMISLKQHSRIFNRQVIFLFVQSSVWLRTVVMTRSYCTTFRITCDSGESSTVWYVLP